MMPNAGPHILIVDDRAENLLALEAILEPLGHRIVRAGSGEEALRAVLRHDFAVILLDVQMPGMNGFETATVLKSRARSRHTPIIFLTAISKEERFVYEGYSVGAVDYMPKPLQPDILRSKVTVFVELWQKNREIARQAELLRSSERRELEYRHAAQLRETEARAAQILETATEAIITFDAEHHIVVFNRAAEQMFGMPAAVATARGVEALLHPSARSQFLHHLHVRQGKERRAMPRPEIYTALRSDGVEFPFEASLSGLDLGDGAVFTLIGRDVSERQRAEQALRTQAVELANTMAELTSLNDELQRRQGELERAINSRSRFYASMSHELRTPINAILGYSSLLLDRVYGELNDTQIQGIERTKRAAKHLLELVNDVLDLSKIEAGKLELQFEVVPFPALIDDLFITMQPLADQHGCDLDLEIRGEPRSITSDPRRVRQILLNLVSNAIKFGREKPVRVIYGATEEGGIEVAVVDQGPGIAPDDLARIFEEFVQLPATSTAEGTGLGLPISRRFAVLLGGAITVDSAPGAGSTFRLWLPATPPQARYTDLSAASVAVVVTEATLPGHEPAVPAGHAAAETEGDPSDDAGTGPAGDPTAMVA